MKRNLLIIVCTLITVISFGQKKEWKQMQDFHDVISKTYHPAEEGNLQPVKTNADLLVQRAEAWLASATPTGYDEKKVKTALKKLVNDCKSVKLAVHEKKSDSELKKLITATHETFHELMEKEER